MAVDSRSAEKTPQHSWCVSRVPPSWAQQEHSIQSDDAQRTSSPPVLLLCLRLGKHSPGGYRADLGAPIRPEHTRASRHSLSGSPIRGDAKGGAMARVICFEASMSCPTTWPVGNVSGSNERAGLDGDTQRQTEPIGQTRPIRRRVVVREGRNVDSPRPKEKTRFVSVVSRRWQLAGSNRTESPPPGLVTAPSARRVSVPFLGTVDRAAIAESEDPTRQELVTVASRPLAGS